MTATTIPILCGACNTQIAMPADQLEKKLACPSCHEPIRVADYDVLVRERDRMRAEKREAIEAENERIKGMAEAVRQEKIQEREREREKKRLAILREDEFKANEKRAEAQSLEDSGGVITSLSAIIGGIAFAIGALCLAVAASYSWGGTTTAEGERSREFLAIAISFAMFGMFTFLVVAVVRYLAKIRKEVRELRKSIESRPLI